MPRYAFAFEVDGTDFHGTQIQGKGERTVQEVVAGVLAPFACTGLPRPASRLDQGVSAEWFPVDALLEHPPRGNSTPGSVERTLALALAANLPKDLAVRAVAQVADTWHAQHAACDKTYRYRILVRATGTALDLRCWWVKRLDHPELLPELAAMLPGHQDLRRFACLRRDGTDEDDGTRTIHRATWTSEPWLGGTVLTFRVCGTGFLYKQVRGFVGAMVQVAMGKRSVDEFRQLVAGDDQITRLGNIAPPDGLTLEQVTYDPEPAWVAP